ncbi:Appr-1-p processing protein [Tenacibaculum sp. 190524A02b]|uniref:macro domain-containing protein n=1 Tax=Tenacibaculum vairaonense TaxID=3137860 RepID=UPI0032B2F13B
METIEYIEGDATNPIGTGIKIIVHVCNDIGGWGKGFVLAISKKWKKPEKAYRKWHASKEDFGLGEVQFVQVEADLWIANLIGQHKIRKSPNGLPPIRYEAIESGLKKVAVKALSINASVHMPRIGCGLAGGKWDKIEPIVQENLISKQVLTIVYDFK